MSGNILHSHKKFECLVHYIASNLIDKLSNTCVYCDIVIMECSYLGLRL